MPKITSVEPQSKNPHRFNVFLDEKFAFGVDEDLVVDKRLVMGKEISTDELKKLLFETEVGKLMERMYRLFNIRQRSEQEVRDKLRIMNYELRIKGRKEISDLAIELVINKLKQKRLINDEEFAKAWVQSRSKKKGKIALKQELMQKGVNKEIIDEVISEVTGEHQIAEKLLSKKLGSWRSLPRLEFRKKAYEFLMRKGFEYEIVKDIVENISRKG